MLYYGLEWHSLDTYMQFDSLGSAPDTPADSEIRQYAIESGGISTMCWKNDAGNITCLPTGGGTLPSGSGATGAVAFWNGTSTLSADSAKFFYDDTNDQLLLGINSGSHFSTDTGLCVDENASSAIVGATAHSATQTHSGGLNLQRSRGTHAAPTIVSADDRIARFVAQAYDGSAYRDAAAVDAYVDTTPGSNDMPGRLSFWTTPDGSTTLSERARISSAGKLLIGGTWGTHTGSDGLISIDSDAANAILELSDHNAAGNPYIFGHRSRGSHSSPSIVSDGDNIFVILGKAYGNDYHDAARIAFQVDGTPGNSDMPSRIVFSVTPDGSATLSERMWLKSTGALGLGTSTPNYAGHTQAMTIQSVTNVAMELASSRADADNVLIGSVEGNYRTNNSGHQRIANVQFKTTGSTANQRGGKIVFGAKADASGTITDAVTIDSSGMTIANNLTVNSNLFAGSFLQTSTSAGMAFPASGVRLQCTLNDQIIINGAFNSDTVIAPARTTSDPTLGSVGLNCNGSRVLTAAPPGIVAIGTTTYPSTGTSGLIFGDGTALASMGSNTAGLYANDVSGTVTMHVINENGDVIRLGKVATYTPSNVTTDRSFDADTVAIAELADVVGTLIGDLQTLGYLG